MPKIFIDGQEGTTGLKILERFRMRSDITLLQIDEKKRKDIDERKSLINESDVTFLCLPDDAAKAAVKLAENPKTHIIDASTAHRCDPFWAYGFPELSGAHREKIAGSKRIAVPGCYATGFNALLFPIIKAGFVEPHYPVFAYGVSGYSGGGKTRIAQYENPTRVADFDSPMLYSLGLQHKHLPEMKMYSGLSYVPMFTPIICDYYSGMLVVVPLQSRLLKKRLNLDDFRETYDKHYANSKFIRVLKKTENEDMNSVFLAANTLRDTNFLEIMVLGNDEQILLVARLDNLGKGASGAAVQCMNIMLGFDESRGLL